MGKTRIHLFNDTRNGFLFVSDLGSDWSSLHNPNYHLVGGLFASVNQLGAGSILSPDPPNRDNNSSFAAQLNDLCTKYLPFKKKKRRKKK